jgi:hypothetical protein
MTLLGKILSRRPSDLLLATEALLLLVFFRVCLALVPARRIIRSFTRGVTEDATGDPVAEDAVEFARRVRWAVSAVARHSAVEFVCFPQALAGYTMLRWRNVPSAIIYGVTRSPAGELLAHTWLMVGDRMILGGENAGQFTPVERWS